jgi:hypothetical protein
MRREYVLFLIGVLLLALRQGPPVARAQAQQENTPKCIYSTEPINLDVDQLPSGYCGHDPEIIAKVFMDRKKNEAKSEFETTEAWRARVQGEAQSPITGSLYVNSIFGFMADLQSSYNADQGMLQTELRLKMVTASDGSYIDDYVGIMAKNNSRDVGTETVSVRGQLIKVTMYTVESYEVGFANIGHFPLGTYQPEGGPTRPKIVMNPPISADPDTAKRLKVSLRALVVCKLAAPFTTVRPVRQSASESQPFAVLGKMVTLHADLLQIWLYDLATGKVLTRMVSKPNPQDDRLNRIVIRTLFSAVAQDDMATIEALLAKGVDVNAKNESGQTALMIAARYARTTIVQFLVAKGADPNIKDKQGWTALKHAQSSPEIVNILKNAKAKK